MEGKFANNSSLVLKKRKPTVEKVPQTDGAAQIVTVATIYSFMLTAITFGAVFCFKGTNRWLIKSSTVTHRDIASARFLHVSQDPNSRGEARRRGTRDHVPDFQHKLWDQLFIMFDFQLDVDSPYKKPIRGNYL